MGRTDEEIEMKKHETDEQINAWLDRLDETQLRIWAAPEPKAATNLAELSVASGRPLARLKAEAEFIGESEESYLELILDRITDNPFYVRHRELAEARLARKLSA